jgi:polar amino acid transport system permease protein
MAYQMQFGAVLERAPEFVEGTINTIQLAGQGIVVGLLIGLVVALLRDHGPRWLNWISAGYVEIIRNTPLLVQVFLFFFGLPYIGVQLSADASAIIAISFNLGAYSAEIFRAGFNAIPKSQIEAGLSLGLSRLEVIRQVVIVPALKVIYPALTGQLTLTLLGSSIVSAISANELTLAAARVESLTFRSLETFLVAGAIYITLTFIFRFAYWLISIWLFGRKNAAHFHMVDAVVTLPKGAGS